MRPKGWFMTDQENFQLEQPAAPQPPAGAWLQNNRRTAIIAGAVVVVIIAAIIAFAVGGNDSKSSGSNNATTQQVGLNVDGLKTAVTALGRKVYWAGDEADNQYVLQTLANGQATIRYIPKDGNSNESQAIYRVIGSYPIKDAFGVTTKAGEAEGSVLITNADGSIVVYNKNKTTNVYVAFPNVDVQIEIYDPSGQALALATSGRVVPIG